MATAQAADDWWRNITDADRIRIFGWLGPKESTHQPVTGQLEIPIPAPRRR